MSFISRIRSLSPRSLLLGILLTSFLITVVYAFYFRIHPVVDAQAYDQIAVNLINGCGFREDCSRDFLHDPAITRAGPAYEFFLAGIYRLFGQHYEIVWIIQAFLHVLTAYLLYLSAKRLFPEIGEKAGLIAAAVIAFHPDLIEIAAMLMTETLYLFLITLTLYLFILMYQDSEKWILSCMLGCITGVAILSRPPVLLFVPIILLVYLFRKHYRQGLFFLLVLIAVLTPWTMRNYRVFHTFIPTTLIGEYNLWVGNTLESNGGQLSHGFNPVTTYGETYGYSGLKQEAKHQFWQFIFTHPVRFIQLCIIRFVTYFSLIRPMGFWFYQTGISQIVFVVLSGFATVFLFVSGFGGMYALLKQKKGLYNYFIAFALTAPVVLIPTVVQSRYRFQIYPFLALSAGYLIARYRTHEIPTAHTRRILILSMIVLGIISFIDIILFRHTIFEHLHTLFS